MSTFQKPKRRAIVNSARLNAYRTMWIIVLFDLPTNTAKERKTAATFRKRLLNGGFDMMQYSVYKRFCVSREAAKKHEGRVKKIIPPDGVVQVLFITSKQHGQMSTFYGGCSRDVPKDPEQIEMF